MKEYLYVSYYPRKYDEITVTCRNEKRRITFPYGTTVQRIQEVIQLEEDRKQRIVDEEIANPIDPAVYPRQEYDPIAVSWIVRREIQPYLQSLDPEDIKTRVLMELNNKEGPIDYYNMIKQGCIMNDLSIVQFAHSQGAELMSYMIDYIHKDGQVLEYFNQNGVFQDQDQDQEQEQEQEDQEQEEQEQQEQDDQEDQEQEEQEDQDQDQEQEDQKE